MGWRCRHRRRGGRGGDGRDVLLLGAGDHHILSQLGVRLLECAGQPIPGSSQFFLRRLGLIRQQSNGGLLGGRHGLDARGSRRACQPVLIPQVGRRDRRQQRQARQQSEGQQPRPGDPALGLGRVTFMVVRVRVGFGVVGGSSVASSLSSVLVSSSVSLQSARSSRPLCRWDRSSSVPIRTAADSFSRSLDPTLRGRIAASSWHKPHVGNLDLAADLRYRDPHTPSCGGCSAAPRFEVLTDIATSSWASSSESDSCPASVICPDRLRLCFFDHVDKGLLALGEVVEECPGRGIHNALDIAIGVLPVDRREVQCALPPDLKEQLPLLLGPWD